MVNEPAPNQYPATVRNAGSYQLVETEHRHQDGYDDERDDGAEPENQYGLEQGQQALQLLLHARFERVRCELLLTPEKGARRARDNSFASEIVRAVAADSAGQSAFVRQAIDGCGRSCNKP